MIARVVTEGKSDVALLSAVLASAGVGDVAVIDAGGKSSAKSLGISLALSRRGPVAIVLDADTSDKKGIQEQLAIFGDLQPHHLREECKLFLAVPTLEVELFPDAHAFSTISGLKLDRRQIGEFETHREELASAFVAASGRVHTNGIDWLARRPLIAKLLTFLNGIARRPQVGLTRTVKGRRTASP